MQNLLGKTFVSKKPGLKVIVTEHSDAGFNVKALNAIGDIKKNEIIEYTTVGGFLSRFTEVPDEKTIDYMERMKLTVKNVITDKSDTNSVFLLRNGKFGIGIIHTLQEQLKEANTPYIMIRGQDLMLHQRPTNTLAKLLANLLKEHSDKVIVFDDCDEFVQDPMCGVLLKASMEKYFSYISSKPSGAETISADFNGKMIFVYNNPESTIDFGIQSRSFLFNL